MLCSLLSRTVMKSSAPHDKNRYITSNITFYEIHCTRWHDRLPYMTSLQLAVGHWSVSHLLGIMDWRSFMKRDCTFLILHAWRITEACYLIVNLILVPVNSTILYTAPTCMYGIGHDLYLCAVKEVSIVWLDMAEKVHSLSCGVFGSNIWWWLTLYSRGLGLVSCGDYDHILANSITDV